MSLDFIAGCIGGCAGVVVGHPLDTVKVRLQTQDIKNPLYKGTWHCFRSIVKKEKVGGLFKGVTSPLSGVAVVNAIVFGIHGNFNRTFGDSFGTHVMSGVTAGFVESFIASPLELAKTRLQLQTGRSYKGAIDCLSKVYRSQGIRGVYKGLGLTILREAPSYGFYFLTYELLTGGQDVPTWQMLLAGGTAGCASWIVVYPVDIIKTRMQSDGVNGPAIYRNALHCLRVGLKSEGYHFLGRGFVPTVLRAFPTNAVTFTVVGWVMRLADMVPVPPEDIPKLGQKDLSGFVSAKRIFSHSIHLFEEGSLAM